MFNELSVKRDPVSTAVSTGLHLLLAGLIIFLAIHHFATPTSPTTKTITLLDPDPTPIPLHKSNGAKSGGGANEPTPPTKGSPPPQSKTNLTPPTVHIQQQPTLPVPMTQPDKMPAVFPNIGDPTAKATLIASNGPGFPTGIGAGKNGGIGDKDGPGGANGHCNPGDNCYGADGVDTEPSVLYKSDPEFSEEARKSKQQGIVVVCMWVTASGTATHIQPVQRLGFGLDESVVKSVATWRFKPATKAGKPVTVSDVCVNVDFRMY